MWAKRVTIGNRRLPSYHVHINCFIHVTVLIKYRMICVCVSAKLKAVILTPKESERVRFDFLSKSTHLVKTYFLGTIFYQFSMEPMKTV